MSTSRPASHSSPAARPAWVLSKLAASISTPAGSTTAIVTDSLCGSTPAPPCCVTLNLRCSRQGRREAGVGTALLGSAGQAPFKPAPIPPPNDAPSRHPERASGTESQGDAAGRHGNDPAG